MSVVSQQNWLREAQPRNFASLMALYESNYRRFLRLAPEPDLPFDYAVSHGQDRPLYLQVLERCRYTVTVHLTYWFTDGQGGSRADPDLRLRLSRDAGLVEAVYCDARSRYAALAGVP